MDKTYKCPCCGSEIKVLVEKHAEKDAYLYILGCQMYSCGMPFSVFDVWIDPNNENLADGMYDHLVKKWNDWEKHLREMKIGGDINDT